MKSIKILGPLAKAKSEILVLRYTLYFFIIFNLLYFCNSSVITSVKQILFILQFSVSPGYMREFDLLIGNLSLNPLVQ